MMKNADSPVLAHVTSTVRSIFCFNIVLHFYIVYSFSIKKPPSCKFSTRGKVFLTKAISVVLYCFV